jgi:hypothetical protein
MTAASGGFNPRRLRGGEEVLGRRDGADIEGARSDRKGNGAEADLVGGGRDYGSDRPDNETLAGANRGGRLHEPVRSAQASESKTNSDGRGATGAEPVSGEVFGFQRSTFSREAGQRPSNRSQLHVGQEGPTVGRAGEDGQARKTPQTPTPAADPGNDAAHRRQQTPVAIGSVARLHRGARRCHQRDLLRPIGR